MRVRSVLLLFVALGCAVLYGVCARLRGPSGYGQPYPPAQATIPWEASYDYWLGAALAAKPIEGAVAIVCGTGTADDIGRQTKGPAFGRQVQGRWHTLQVTIDDPIKGVDPSAAAVSVRFFLPDQYPIEFLGPEPYALQLNVRYLLFLKEAEGRKGYDLWQSRDGGPPPLPLAAPPRELNEDAMPRDRLVAELEATARQDRVELAAPAIPPLGYLATSYAGETAKSALKELTTGSQPELAVLAIRSLTSGPHMDQALLPLLEELSESDNRNISASAVAARICLADASALQQAGTWGQDQELPEARALELAGAIERAPFEKGSEEVVQGLQSVMRSHEVRLRRAAACAFRKIATRDLTDALMKLLDDPDREVQFNATMALYEAAEGWHNTLVKGWGGVAKSIFMEDPDRYIGQWKRWWQDGGKIELPRDEEGNIIPTTRL